MSGAGVCSYCLYRSRLATLLFFPPMDGVLTTSSPRTQWKLRETGLVKGWL